MKSWPLLLTLLIACGPMNPEAPVGPTGNTSAGTGTATPAKPAAAGDVSLDLESLPITGTVYELSPRVRPPTPIVEPNPRQRKPTLAQQRSIFSNARDPVLKQAQAAILATMLYKDSKTAEKAQEKDLLKEARQALRDAASAAGKDVDEVTLRLLGSYELLMDDYPAAEKAWQDLITKDPKDKDLPSHKAWLAYSMLQQGKNAEALAVVSTEALTDKQPELAYVIAWAKWRTGDGAAAWEAIVTAAKGWGNYTGKDDVQDQTVVIATHTKIPFAQAMPRLFEVFAAQQPAQQYDVLARLVAKSYQEVGRWTEAIAAIEEALKIIGAQVPPIDRAYLRYSQAELTVRLDTPDVAVRYAKQAIEALDQCPKCTEKEKQDLVMAVAVMARLFHILYATANDIRYYQPANDLYVLTIPRIADPKRRAERNSDAEILQRTLKNTKVGTGTHSKDAVGVIVERHSKEVQGCYEERLVQNPKIGGTLVVTLDSDQSGAIKGVATEPKAGQADLAAVAGCVAERARKWNLPKRGMGGTTRVKAPFTLAPKAAGAK
jgi:tetratricopeptide (TPR) repeat protein